MSDAKHSIVVLLAVLLTCGAIWFAISAPPLSTPRVFLNQRQAVQSVRDLNLAEHRFIAQHPGMGLECDLSKLGEQGFVDRVIASGTRSGYILAIQCLEDNSPKAMHYTITAVPVVPGMTGNFALCADQGGEIWYSENGSVSDCLAKHKPIEQKYR